MDDTGEDYKRLPKKFRSKGLSPHIHMGGGSTSDKTNGTKY